MSIKTVEHEVSYTPGIIDAIVGYDGSVFKSGQIDSRHNSSQVGNVAKSLEKDGVLKIDNEGTQVNKYSFQDEYADMPTEEVLEEYREFAEGQWTGKIETVLEEGDYDLSDIEEDIPDNLHFWDGSDDVRLVDLKDTPLNQDTKRYLSELGVIESVDEMVLQVDDIDLQYVEQFFS